MNASRWVHLNVLLVKKATDKALLVVIDGEDEEVWLPRSQISDPDDYEEGDEDCTISITEWLAKEKGLDS